jgi:hypothetical protein
MNTHRGFQTSENLRCSPSSLKTFLKGCSSCSTFSRFRNGDERKKTSSPVPRGFQNELAMHLLKPEEGKEVA